MNSANDGSVKKYVSQRRTVDMSSPYDRLYFYKKHAIPLRTIQPESTYTADIMPPDAYRDHRRVLNIPTKFTHLSSNKVKHVIPAITWTPEGRRLVVATYSGEFSLWNGSSFNFESIMQAHDSAVTVMQYSHAGDWLISGDADGTIKIWQPNFNMVKVLDRAHTECMRDISFSYSDQKFVTCSDDNVLKIWNFSNGQQERVLSGHHWDVKSCDWHPKMGLIVSGSKDNLIKLWDPRTGRNVSTILGLKHTVIKTKFQPTQGNLLAVVSKDKSIKIYDMRQHMRELQTIRDDMDYMSLSWHPINETIFSVGCYNGAIKHFDLLHDNSNSTPACHTIPYAHEKSVTSLAYSPVGHILASAAKDRTIRFWARSRPVDPNAFDDPTYNNKKVNAWYFGINNNINAVRPKTEHGIALPPANETNLGTPQPSILGSESIAANNGNVPASGLPGLSF
ncbi:ADL184Wp [Eremothecium gossypii ATCC 10895]|uniref:Polyadenylation factor subunit 2 n=1 Tax=Eremothecium gossypii (strain ATCC 10895 / CBS 109.51 / FGSC 9923 / NRRL Y-1056) TaxID=284811 RepID=PFS2_EREGS|nr:ADL184Wp [Eremothecium gossypii ATCC 10895]Q75AV4.1 RecName: Full=Polyadenylation factor subunit 2 [Eremothecium gossypii ATCC 10895]AAS51736.1 ADL184Wp [Eremothecium gossypii ATCC 10895]AEY96033.1 FADL184Wp [Eremothecium gossypii FDAG1]